MLGERTIRAASGYVTDVTMKSFRGIVELVLIRMTYYTVVVVNIDMTSIRGGEYMSS